MIFENIMGFINQAVGNNLDNDPEDVRAVKRNLSQTGHFDDDTENEFMTRDLDTAIKGFQRDNDLKEDGTIFPRRETERAMVERIENRRADDVFGRVDEGEDAGQIGFGGNVSGTFDNKEEKADSSPFIMTANMLSESQPVPKPERKPLRQTDKPQEKPVQRDATGRVIRNEGKSTQDKESSEKNNFPLPTTDPVDKKTWFKILDYDPNRGGGDLHSLFRFGLEPDRITSYAEQKANEFVPTEKAFEDENDAFRHALGSYIMTQRYGEKNSKLILDRHERAPMGGMSPSDSEGSLLQDLYNNRVGREAALDHKNKDRKPEDVIMELYKAGKLQTRPFNVRVLKRK